MRPLALLLVIACGSERASDQQRPAPRLDEAQVKKSIDVTVTGAPLSIRGVEATTPRADGDFEISYRVDASGAAVVPARVMCRVGERNVVYPVSAAGKLPGPRLTSAYRADPFDEVARLCEIEFLYATSEHAPLQRVARACIEAGKLRDGACTEGSFAVPTIEPRAPITIERAALEMRDSAIVVTGLFTLLETIDRNRRFLSTIACRDGKGVVTGEGELAFLPIDALPRGASIYGPLTIFVDRTPALDAQCTLQLVSRAATGAPAERVHAQYCLTTRAVRAGGCS